MIILVQSNPLVRRILKRLHVRDMNYLALVCGGTGTGKSETSLELARLIDPNFRVGQIVFSVEDFFNLLNSGRLKRGSAVVWEEMGIAADSRMFYSLQNKAITYCFESFRWLNLAVIMNLPGLGMVDSRVKKLAHQYFETQKIDYTRKICRCSLFDMQYNPRMDKIFFKYPFFWVDGQKIRADSIDINKPPDELVKKYKRIKKMFSKKLNLDLEAEIEDSKIDKTIKTADVGYIVKEVLRRQKRYVHDFAGKQTVKTSLIQAQFNVGFVTANKAKAALELALN